MSISQDSKNANWLNALRYSEVGLIPAIAQDNETGKILMFAWMNRESLQLSVQEGYAVYWSRSRQKLWRKGEDSGHRQKIISLHLDCDEDVLLLKIEQEGGIACHTGRESCFYRQLIAEKWETVEAVIKNPLDIYPEVAKNSPFSAV